MRILVDTNVIIDALTGREPFRKAAEQIFLIAANRTEDLFITASSATDIYYLIRKHLHSTEKAKNAMQKLFELFSILDIFRTKKVTVIGVTENLSSPLAAKSHIVLPMKVTSETDRYNSQGTSSFIALAAVFDALQTAVIEETGYQNEQFALIHPGGAVGKRLNNRNI